jgi:hypothetical protein
MKKRRRDVTEKICQKAEEPNVNDVGEKGQKGRVDLVKKLFLSFFFFFSSSFSLSTLLSLSFPLTPPLCLSSLAHSFHSFSLSLRSFPSFPLPPPPPPKKKKKFISSGRDLSSSCRQEEDTLGQHEALPSADGVSWPSEVE